VLDGTAPRLFLGLIHRIFLSGFTPPVGGGMSHVWSCENCGHEIEMAVTLRFDAMSAQSTALNRQQLHNH
jgi:hypothetical protein